MTRNKTYDNKHLSLDERKIIQAGIENRCTKKSIADTIGKDPTTVAKEIRVHRTLKPRNTFNNRIMCIHIKSCTRCIRKCERYEESSCHGRDRSPGACNKCEINRSCRLDKYLYNGENAHKEYLAMLSETREGISLEPKERVQVGSLIAPLLKQGQSVHQIVANHSDELLVCERALYNYIEMGVFKDFGIDNFSLKEVVNRKRFKNKYKKRKQPAVYDYHKYIDYLAFLDESPDTPTTEMDTVYNQSEGPYIQTFIFGKTGFMIGRLHKTKESASMAATIDDFQTILSDDMFCSLFCLLLTDRGSEFEKIPLFETNSSTEETRLNIFFCDPMQSSQKPHVENNHNYLRDIIPRKVSLAKLTQDDLDLTFSHINSTPRKSLNDHSPYEVFSFLYGEQTASLLDVCRIERDDVILKPYLLRHVYR